MMKLKEYLVRVHLGKEYSGSLEFLYKGKPTKVNGWVAGQDQFFSIAVGTRASFGSKDWENDMINGVFDDVTDFDWSKVTKLDYGQH